MIAPSGAKNISLKFLFFDMGPEKNYNEVFIDACRDLSCTSYTALKGSPFRWDPSSPLISDIDTVQTGYVRVRYPSRWSGHTQARFVLKYSSNPSDSPRSQGLAVGVWHYVVAVIQSMNQSSLSAGIYVNGTLIAGPAHSQLEQSSESGLVLVGESGIAVGRVSPMSAPFGYFSGRMDELLLIDRIVSAEDMKSMMTTSCSKVPKTILCLSFDTSNVSRNGSILDLGSGRPSNAVPVFQDRFLPWCFTRNDDGQLLMDTGTAVPKAYGVSWGMCTSKARLPGVAFDYDPSKLNTLRESFENASHGFDLKDLPGCANTPLIIDHNIAGRWVNSLLKQ
jgi:hypothetical protein